LIHFARIRNIWKGRGCARSKALRHVYLRISSQDRAIQLGGLDRLPLGPLDDVRGTVVLIHPPALEHLSIDGFVDPRRRAQRSFFRRNTDGPVESSRNEAIETVRELAVGVADGWRDLRSVDDDLVAEN
jgi:hypothetical protein